MVFIIFFSLTVFMPTNIGKPKIKSQIRARA